MTILTQEKLIKNFARCKDWEERYLYLIELGTRYSVLPELMQTQERLVAGCQSKVWLDISVTDEVLSIQGNSDTAIVKGMVALLVIILDNQPAALCEQAQLNAFFNTIGLQESLTPVRNQGLAAMMAFINNQLITQRS